MTSNEPKPEAPATPAPDKWKVTPTTRVGGGHWIILTDARGNDTTTKTPCDCILGDDHRQPAPRM